MRARLNDDAPCRVWTIPVLACVPVRVNVTLLGIVFCAGAVSKYRDRMAREDVAISLANDKQHDAEHEYRKIPLSWRRICQDFLLFTCQNHSARNIIYTEKIL